MLGAGALGRPRGMVRGGRTEAENRKWQAKPLVTNGKSELICRRCLADIGEGAFGAVVSQILAEIMVDVEKTLLMGGPF